MKKLFIYTLLSIVIIALLRLVSIAITSHYLSGPLITSGASMSTPYIELNSSDKLEEVLVISSVTPNGAFDEAGLREGDIVLGHSFDLILTLKESIALHQGKIFRICILRGKDIPIQDRKKYDFDVSIPNT